MTSRLQALHTASPEASEALRRLGEAEASIRVWREIRLEGGGPSCVDGEWRACGYGKLLDARESIRRAAEIVERLIAEHPDVVAGPTTTATDEESENA